MRLCRCCQNCLVWSRSLVHDTQHNKCNDSVQSSFCEVCNFFDFINIWVMFDQFFSGSEQNADSNYKWSLKRKFNLIGRDCWCAPVVMVFNVLSCSTVFYLVLTICCILQQGRYLVDELTSDHLFLKYSCPYPGSTKMSSKAKKDMLCWSEIHRSAFVFIY